MIAAQRATGNVVRMLLTTIVSIIICFSVLLPGIGLAANDDPTPNVLVEGDFLISYDDVEVTGALHPSVAVSPLEGPFPGSIHAVWDEVDEETGIREIHYSKTDPSYPDYPYDWSNDEESEGDRIISQTRKGKLLQLDAVDPDIAIDSAGVIHVVWAEAYDDQGYVTWEIHYAFSMDNGKFWSSETGQDPGQDIVISKYTGERQDAEAIPGGPKIAISRLGNSKAPDPAINVVWAEYTSKNGQEIYHSHSRNGGATWSGQQSDRIISSTGSPEYAFEPAIAASGEFGEFMHVAWKQDIGGGKDEIFYTQSTNFGDEWTGQEDIISDPGLAGTIQSVDVAAGFQDVHVVWSQEQLGKAPATGVFYTTSMTDGQDWIVKEYMISNPEDGNPANDVSVAALRIVAKAPLTNVHVTWSEFDDNSPKGTMEIHESQTNTPYEPDSWTGQPGDIVISWPDPVVGANAQNATVAIGNIAGEYQPWVVWDEMNLTSSKNGRGQPNTEIHTEPPVIEFTLTTGVVGSGTIVRNPNQSTYPDGTPVQLTASPSAGWLFDHWSGDLSGSTNPDTITMDSDKSVTAHFVHRDLVAASVSGPASCTEGATISISRSFNNAGTLASGTFLYGLYLSTNSIISTGDTLIYSYQYPSLNPGSGSTGSVNVGLPMGLTGTYYYGLIVDVNGEVSESNEGNNAVASASTVTINPAQFTLTVNIIGSGTVTKNPNQATYTYNQVVQLTANPSAGWAFSGWSGDLGGSNNPETITMTGNKVVTATFVQNQYTLTVSTSGSGSVIKNPNQATYTYGTPVTLTANPNTGWYFDYWSGDLTGSTNPDVITIYGNSAVTAHFAQEQYTLTTSVIGSGSVTKNPNQATYTYGQTVTVTAIPSAGWAFDYWGGDLSGSTNPETITITGNMNVIAYFIQEQYTLTVSTTGSGSVSKNPNQATYTYGTPVTLTANPSAGWYFDYWTGDLTGSTNPDVITMYGDSSVIAHFAQEQYTLSISISGSGSVIKNPNQATYTYGQTVQLSAVPNTGWKFDHWAGAIGGTSNPASVTIWGDTSVTAYFVQLQYNLDVYIMGSGTVLKSPDQATYTYGQVVTLTGNGNTGWEFDHWAGDMSGTTNPDTITITGHMSVTAYFVQEQYTLNVWAVGSGTVSKSPNQATYTYGQVVTLTANAAAGWEFDHWAGAITGTINPKSLTITGNTNVWAYFEEIVFMRSLVQGWNLVSFPLEQTDTSITTVLSSISGNWDIVQYYDAADTSDHWKTYATFKPPSLNDLTDLDHTMSFWLHIKVPSCVMTLNGAEPVSTSIQLRSGWNLVGYPTRDTTTNIMTALAGTGYDSVEGFDAGDPYLLQTLPDSYVMQPGEGYWVHVPADTTWIVDW